MSRPRQLRVHRHGYTRRGGIHVSGSNFLVRDRGKPGRTAKEDRWAQFEGNLHGWHADQAPSTREDHIRESIAADGYLVTWRRLDQLSKVMKRTNPTVSQTARRDRNWVSRAHRKELHIARTRER
jgi:hypothetical protein